MKFIQKKTAQKKILLGHLFSFGDCLYATTVARQIKEDFPGCRLTWAIGSPFRSVLDGNPYIDDVWEVVIKKEEANNAWIEFECDARKRKKRGDFDEVYFTQFFPSHLYNYDGMIRSSIFRGYPKPITVPVSPVVRLSTNEVDNVRRFAERFNLAVYKHILLFECAPKSGQSFITPDFALAVSQKLVDSIPDICIILSSNNSIATHHPRIIDGSILSFRENAELTKYCTLLVGCSSGITWISTSDWAKPLPMIQLIKQDAVFFAPVVYDFERWGIPTDAILEMSSCTVDTLANCINIAVTQGIDAAKSMYHQNIPFSFQTYIEFLFYYIRHFRFIKAFRMIYINLTLHGFHGGRVVEFVTSVIQRRFNRLKTT